MNLRRRDFSLGLAAGLTVLMTAGRLPAQVVRPSPDQVIHTWYRLVLELVRHTATYSPPVASRAFAYLGVTAFEVLAQSDPQLVSFAGQAGGLTPLPPHGDGMLDDTVVLHQALATSVAHFFGNTGPTGQRAMKAMDAQLGAQVMDGVVPDVVDRSRTHGQNMAAHIIDWSMDDGGAVIRNMGFPMAFDRATAPEKWVPTNVIVQQQAPLLPDWGQNRTFAMPSGADCGLPPPPAYSEDPGSEFHAQALEVYDTVRNLTPEQRATARFWSDDPMLSPTPPGHWISIAMQVLEAEAAPAARRAEVLALTGIALSDAFVACWHSKFEYNLLRPITYIRRVIDPKFEAVLNTPPFPEYPSGHSTQSAAAAAVLTAMFGENYAFSDATHVDDGLPARNYDSFAMAAEEAGISRLYGGIHFRAAIEQGLEQGRCVGAFVTALKTRAG